MITELREWWGFTSRNLGSLLDQSLTAGQKYLLLKGFRANTIKLLNLNHRNFDAYLTDREKKRTSRLTNTSCAKILTNKSAFNQYFDDVLPLPEILFRIVDGVEVSLPATSYPTIIRALEDLGHLVIKPEGGGQGKDLHFVSLEAGVILNNNHKVTRSEFQDWLGTLSKHIVSKKIEQHPLIRAVYPATVNALRIITVNQNSCKMVYAFQRFGTHRSVPNDAFISGGLASSVNIDTGVLSKAISLDKEGNKTEHAVHPETGSQIDGLVVPNWKFLRTSLLTKMNNHPAFNYVGWDVVVTNNGFCVIEGNHNPGTLLMQIFQPVRNNPEIFDFFRHVNVIRDG